MIFIIHVDLNLTQMIVIIDYLFGILNNKMNYTPLDEAVKKKQRINDEWMKIVKILFVVILNLILLDVVLELPVVLLQHHQPFVEK